jgi:hypothetical protein
MKLVKQYFHTFDARGRLKWQGYVVKRRKDGRYTCQLFEWILGTPSDRVTMSRDKLRAARLYSSAEQWREAAKALQA